MATKHVAAKDVRVGDKIFNAHAYCPGAAWVEVIKVEPQPNGRVHLVTPIYTDGRWQEEGITVERAL